MKTDFQHKLVTNVTIFLRIPVLSENCYWQQQRIVLIPFSIAFLILTSAIEQCYTRLRPYLEDGDHDVDDDDGGERGVEEGLLVLVSVDPGHGVEAAHGHQDDDHGHDEPRLRPEAVSVDRV